MLHYGGIYLDLDNGCNSSLDALLSYPVWLTDGGQGALSNNILGSRPHHPFFQLVTQQLDSYNVNYILPYLIISYASGQWFLTDMWQRYHDAIPLSSETSQEHRLYRIMMGWRPGADPWVFFTQGRGGTWDNWDNHFFGWLGNQPNQSMPALIALIILVSAGVWYIFMRSRRRRVKEQLYHSGNRGSP